MKIQSFSRLLTHRLMESGLKFCSMKNISGASQQKTMWQHSLKKLKVMRTCFRLMKFNKKIKIKNGKRQYLHTF